MKKIFEQAFPQPVSPKTLIKILVLIIVILSYIAGYYHSVYQAETKKNEFLLETITKK
ncbi:hypothetical protein GW927_03890 [Candidatus Pacearchaeota archaeon]|nr:hypothetical protein [Candidatus Pacearchaeota archaeon]